MDRNDAEAVIKETIEYANNEIERNRKKSRRIVIASLSSSVIVLLICIFAYFYPLSLSSIIRESRQIDVILNDYEIVNGEPSIVSIVHNDITAEQKEALLNILEEYDYHRTFGTLFSDGSITDISNKTLTIFVYDNHSAVDAIILADSGKIAINDKSYTVENAEQLIEQILENVEPK